MGQAGLVTSCVTKPMKCLNRYHDLAEGFTIDQVLDRFAAALQRERLRHVRFDLALLVHRKHLSEIFLIGRWIARDSCAPEHAANVARLEQGEVQRDLWNTGWETDDEVASFPIHRADRWLSIVAANRVINDVDAAAARFFDLV